MKYRKQENQLESMAGKILAPARPQMVSSSLSPQPMKMSTANEPLQSYEAKNFQMGRPSWTSQVATVSMSTSRRRPWPGVATGRCDYGRMFRNETLLT